MRSSTALIAIAILVALSGVAAYMITGKPQPVGEISGKVLRVMTLTQKTDAKAEMLIELADGRKVRVVTLLKTRPKAGTELLLMEYKTSNGDIRSFEVLSELP